MISTAEARVFALIRALEIDGRNLIDQFLVPILGLTDILNPFQIKISKRIGPEQTFEKSLEYLDFGDIFEIFNANRRHFSSDIVSDLESLRSNTGKIVQIRNAVMHGRSLRENDEESLVRISKGLQSKLWSNLQKTLIALASDEFLTEFEVQPDESKVLHNLPRPEHNDTSLIGRRNQVEEVSALLLQNRSSVITITGAGGIGKTALALEIAYSFVEKESPFELILWASFKNEKLTIEGVKEITSATKSFPELSHIFSEVVGSQADSSFISLSKALNGIDTLMCLDNLETVTGSDFVDFYNAMPDSCKFLITSRRGIGQIERRYELPPISKKDAMHYIYQLIRNHRVIDLQKAASSSIEGIVERYGNNPLAIKWFVQSVSAGIPILEIFKYREKDFFEFCVGSVVHQLGETAQKVLLALKHLGRFISIEELLILSNLDEQDLNEAIRELQINSLIESRITGSEIRQQVQLTESASKYLPNLQTYDEVFLASLRREEARIRQDETDRQKDLQSPYSPYAIATRNDDDLPIVVLLRKSIRESKYDNAKSMEILNTARRLAPDFWEIDKTEAIIRYWNKDYNLVPDLYKSSIAKAPNDEKKSIVHYLFAGFLARQGQGSEALEQLAKIPEYLIDENVLSLRGDCRLRIGLIDQGLEDLKRSIISSDPKTSIVNRTRLMKGYERIAEHSLTREKNFAKSFANLELGFDIFEEMYLEKIRDFKTLENYAGLIFLSLRILEKSYQMSEAQYDESLGRFEKFLNYAEQVITDRRHGPAIRAAFRRQSSLSEKFKLILEERKINVDIDLATETPNQQVVHTGKVINWKDDKKFGFISSDQLGENVYFNESSLFPGEVVEHFQSGKKVSFEIDFNFQPRPGASPKAQFVQVIQENILD